MGFFSLSVGARGSAGGCAGALDGFDIDGAASLISQLHYTTQESSQSNFLASRRRS